MKKNAVKTFNVLQSKTTNNIGATKCNFLDTSLDTAIITFRQKRKLKHQIYLQLLELSFLYQKELTKTVEKRLNRLLKNKKKTHLKTIY